MRAKDAAALRARLGSRLEFGTAGLRGPMGCGSSRMNDLTVIQASQGLCQYVLDHFGDAARERGVVIGYDHRALGTLNSETFGLLTAAAFLSKGVRVHLFRGVVATPLVVRAHCAHRPCACATLTPLRVCAAVRHCAQGLCRGRHGDRLPQPKARQWLQGVLEQRQPSAQRAAVAAAAAPARLYRALTQSAVAAMAAAQIIPPHDAHIAAAIERNLAPWEAYDTAAVRAHALCADPTEEVGEAYIRAVSTQLCRHAADNAVRGCASHALLPRP